MQVNLSSGNFRIIASGETFLFSPNEELRIEIDDGNEFQVKIILKFTDDSSGKHDISTDVVNDSLVINCVKGAVSK